MLRKLFRKKPVLVEIAGVSGQKQIVSQDQYISKTIEERRNEAELARYGLSSRGKSSSSTEYALGRWLL